MRCKFKNKQCFQQSYLNMQLNKIIYLFLGSFSNWQSTPCDWVDDIMFSRRCRNRPIPCQRKGRSTLIWDKRGLTSILCWTRNLWDLSYFTLTLTVVQYYSQMKSSKYTSYNCRINDVTFGGLKQFLVFRWSISLVLDL